MFQIVSENIVSVFGEQEAYSQARLESLAYYRELYNFGCRCTNHFSGAVT